jgi:hypothetical protein
MNISRATHVHLGGAQRSKLIRTMKVKVPFLLFSLALAALPLAAAEMVRLDTTPTGNKIRIEGTSTIHDWQVEGSVIGGFIEVGEGFPRKPGAAVQPGKVPANVSVFIPVRNLKSVEKDGKPYSTSMDKIMYEKLLEPTHKRITYTLKELELKELPKTPDAPYVFESKGELCVAGVTNTITMPVTVTVLGENRVKFGGSVTVKMTDFKITPPAPSVALGLIKTGDEVKLMFEWVAAKRAAPVAAQP